ncbi:MAG: arginine deiminase-related protein, partial [Pseudoxanthomonas sp.]
MLTRDSAAFLAHVQGLPRDFGPATAKAAFLVSPDGFARAEESAQDNRYMAGAGDFDASTASAQHHALQAALSAELPVLCFPGAPATPDAVFPNNVFATVAGRMVIGRMRHPVRQREAGRADVRGFFSQVLGYAEIDLSQQPHVCELTGALVIDRARGIGFCGLSDRCDAQGAALMHEAFGLRATLLFDLAPGEYHTNVVLAVLAGRAVLYSPTGFADSGVSQVLQALYGPHAIALSAQEQAEFAGNAISLSAHAVWMSARAAAALMPGTQQAVKAAGFAIRAVDLSALEAGGGSLRCCVA